MDDEKNVFDCSDEKREYRLWQDGRGAIHLICREDGIRRRYDDLPGTFEKARALIKTLAESDTSLRVLPEILEDNLFL